MPEGINIVLINNVRYIYKSVEVDEINKSIVAEKYILYNNKGKQVGKLLKWFKQPYGYNWGLKTNFNFKFSDNDVKFL